MRAHCEQHFARPQWPPVEQLVQRGAQQAARVRQAAIILEFFARK
jgi:hypothetical protein